MFSTTESFLYHLIRSRIGITMGCSTKCSVFLLISIIFTICPPRIHSLRMKPVGGPGRASHCYVLKMICVQMASPNTSSLIPDLLRMQAGIALPPLKILSIHLQLQLLLRESSMKKSTPLRQPWQHCIKILRQARLHHQTPTTTLLHLLLQLEKSRSSMSSNLFGPY